MSSSEGGVIWGTLVTLWRFIALPFVCKGQEKVTAYCLWIPTWLLILYVGLIANGTLPLNSLNSVLGGFAALTIVVLIFILGHWGADSDDVESDFSNCPVPRVEELL